VLCAGVVGTEYPLLGLKDLPVQAFSLGRVALLLHHPRDGIPRDQGAGVVGTEHQLPGLQDLPVQASASAAFPWCSTIRAISYRALRGVCTSPRSCLSIPFAVDPPRSGSGPVTELHP
jgi:hypothetical protein